MIYSFRGANVSAGMKFVQDNKLVQINMGQNYRSTKTIVNAADGVVRHNKVRIDKECFTENEQGAPIQMFTVSDEEAEAKQVTKIISSVIKKGYSYDDIAILYRYRGQCYAFEKAFKSNKIPYKVLSGGSFFSRKAVKDILAYVKLTVNPNDREAFRRVVNVPNRHVGAVSLNTILNYVNDNDNVSVFEACRSVKLRQRDSRKGVENFLNIVYQLCDIAQYIDSNAKDNDNVSVANLVRETYSLIGYRDYVVEHENDKVEDVESDINTLINIASNYDSIEEFLNATVDTAEESDNEEESTVKLLTLHGSKGLEWPIVIIVGNNDGTIPSFLAVQEGNIEEERRLFFVGMTRAKKVLFLTRAKQIMRNGRNMTTIVNPFIKEIGKDYLVKR